VKSLLPETLHYNPLDYIDLNKGLFIGIDRDIQPMYLPLKDCQKQHADIIGTTGAGRGACLGMHGNRHVFSPSVCDFRLRIA
jgi:hypothetical protein